MPRNSEPCNTFRLAVLVVSALLALNSAWSSPAWAKSAVPPSERIALSDGNPSGTWQTDDVAVDYRSAHTGSQIEFSGQVSFTDQVSATFNTVDYFKLTITFLDVQGNELKSSELLTKSNFSSRAGGLDFSKTVSLPQGASSFAFGYSGQAHSASIGNAIPFTKSFSHKPAR